MEVRIINIYINSLKDPIAFKISEHTIVEDIITDTCRYINIGPVAKQLFALKVHKSNPSEWLHSSYKPFNRKSVKNFEMTIRFNIPDAIKLRSMDPKAYNFFYKQVRNDLICEKIPCIDYVKNEAEVIGLCIIDMYRALKEEHFTRKQLKQKYKQFFPSRTKKAHRWFLREPILRELDKVCGDDHDIFFVKDGYFEQFQAIAPNYLKEDFVGFVSHSGDFRKACLQVAPFDPTFPGITAQYHKKKKCEHLCEINDICFINMVDDTGQIEISRKNGIPVYLKFAKKSTLISFVTLLDGYYRLMIKWTFNLCVNFSTPSLERLQKWRCHGPVSGEFSYRKLAEKRNNKPGTFILRESDLSYCSYFIDVCTKTSSRPITLKIEKNCDGKFVLEGEEKSYVSLAELIKDHKTDNANILLSECLPPSEFDESNLIICRTENKQKDKSEQNKRNEDVLVCIDNKSLRIFKDMCLPGSNPYTTAYRTVWLESRNIKREAATKILNKNISDVEDFAKFLELITEWTFCKTTTLVKFYGFTLNNPFSVVMEYMHLGTLDKYLANPLNRSGIEGVVLIEAAVCLSEALFFLSENKFVHGKIRCRKLFVSEHTTSAFKVKLGDPGIPAYNNTDLHWIPPEFHDDFDKAKTSSLADVWSFGTTIWEIFSFGKTPSNTVELNYDDPCDRLPIPTGCPEMVYSLMLECWNTDVCARITPHGIMRDMNRIFNLIHNSRRNKCPVVKKENSTSVFKSILHLADDYKPHSVMEDDKEDPCDNCSSATTSTTNLTGVGYDSTQSPVYKTLSEITRFVNSEQANVNKVNTITTIQSIFELDKEWNMVLCGLIGQGFYGEVYKGKLLHMYEDREEPVAVKKIRQEAMDYKGFEDFRKEIMIMLKLDHPNIVQFKGVIEDPELCLVLEYIECGSLQNYLNFNKDRLSTLQLLNFALGIVKGMVYLSEQRLVHRDLAARNILVANDYTVKIADFGLTRFIGNDTYYIYQTERHLPIKWYAPESLEYDKFSIQSDVWSYGITLYEMFSLGGDPHLPDVEQKTPEILQALKNGIRLPKPPDCPQHIYTDVMVRCWEYQANLRPTFVELCRFIDDCVPQRIKCDQFF